MSGSSYYNNNNNYYNNQASPPLPHHYQQHGGPPDQYAMDTLNSPSPMPVYSQRNDSNDGLGPIPRQPTPDLRYNQYDSDDDIGEKFVPRERKKRSCIDKMCCGCCTCCPKWLRWCTCIIFIIIVIIAIVVGVLVGIFKVPDVQFTGLTHDPVYTFSNNILSMEFDIGITVDNQNFESLTFDNIKAEAFYPSPYNVYIGGGRINNTKINSFAVTNIVFPFNVNLNSTNPKQQGVLMDLVTRCGLDGSTPENIKFNYYIYPTVKIAGISISPKISKSMSLACPTSELNSILGGLFTKK